MPPQTFNLKNDPFETRDLAEEEPVRLATLEAKLRTIVDPEAVYFSSKVGPNDAYSAARRR
jgi:hypothetical protein